MKHILITGASGGIGQALAMEYASAGVKLTLTGRNQELLESLGHKCRQKGSTVKIETRDLRDLESLESWVTSLDKAHPLDLVIANAGVSSSTGPEEEAEEMLQVRRVFAVNTMAVVEIVLPLAQRMKNRGSGQIAVISSLGGWIGMPSSPSYSASKAATATLGRSLRAWLAPYGVSVSVISPGFVDTPMNRRYIGAKPFRISAQKAAKKIKKGLDSNRAEIAFPVVLVWAVTLVGLLPPLVHDYILRRFFKFYVIPDSDSLVGTENK